MGIPDPGLENNLISKAHSRGAELIESFAAVQPADVDDMSVRVRVVLDDYCARLLEVLREAVETTDAPEAAWLRQHYLSLIVEFATSLRDSIDDSALRHAAAQVIQCKVLEHERNLRNALDGHADHVPGGIAAAAWAGSNRT